MENDSSNNLLIFIVFLFHFFPDIWTITRVRVTHFTLINNLLKLITLQDSGNKVQITSLDSSLRPHLHSLVFLMESIGKEERFPLYFDLIARLSTWLWYWWWKVKVERSVDEDRRELLQGRTKYYLGLLSKRKLFNIDFSWRHHPFIIYQSNSL